MFFFIFKTKIIKALYNIRNKIKKSTGWPTYIKIINGMCWAGPFGLGAIIPPLHEYLILAGIGLGNVSTFIIFLLINKIRNIDQLIVGLICLFSIVLIFFLFYENVIDKPAGEFLARILISIAYGIGGLYSAFIKPE
jgi:predicted branched-subunit amino acid permease